MTQTLEDRLATEPGAAGGELDALLGPGAATAAPGVLHVCSSFEGPAATLGAIRIGPGAPGSELDGFTLRAARAQADAIVTSGSILRHEADLAHELGDDAIGRALSHYRRQGLGRATPPLSVVLSTSGDVPSVHPLWHDWTRTVVWTSPANQDSLRARLPDAVEVVASDDRAPAALLRWLRAQGVRRVSLETGPGAVRGFYAAGLVSELWCARYLGPAPLAAAFRGDPWPFSGGQLERWRLGGSGPHPQASGDWRFDRCAPRAD